MSGEDEPVDQEAKLEEWQRFKTRTLQSIVNRRHGLYMKYRNPMHAVEAYRAARGGKIEIPGWILEVFDRWTKALHEQQPQTAKDIAHALGLASQRGGPSIMRQAQKQSRNLQIAHFVLVLREKDPKRSMLDIFNEAGERFKLSGERVAAIWSELTREPE